MCPPSQKNEAPHTEVPPQHVHAHEHDQAELAEEFEKLHHLLHGEAHEERMEFCGTLGYLFLCVVPDNRVG